MATKMDIGEELAGIARQHKANLEEQVKGSAQSISKAVERVREALRAGQSTKNVTLDLIYLAGYAEVPRALELCEKLQARLKGMVGQAVLVCYHAETENEGWRSDEINDKRHARWFRMGLLDAEVLVYFKTQHFVVGIEMITLSVSKFVTGEARSRAGMGGTWLKGSSVEAHNIFAYTGEQDPPQLLTLLAEEVDLKTPHIIIGNDAVDEWIKGHTANLTLESAVKLLSSAEAQEAA